MQVSIVDVKYALLLCHGVCDSGIAMTDAGHVVVQVDVAASGRVEQVGAFSAHNLDGGVIEIFSAFAEGSITPFPKPVHYFLASNSIATNIATSRREKVFAYDPIDSRR
jgi:hypothetical protein